VSGYDLHRPQGGRVRHAGRDRRGALQGALAARDVGALGLRPPDARGGAQSPARRGRLAARAGRRSRRSDAAGGRAPASRACPRCPAPRRSRWWGSRARARRSSATRATWPSSARAATDAPAAQVIEAPGALWDALADLPAAQAGDVRVRVGARPHDLPGPARGARAGPCRRRAA
jgi:hypothetical protein